MSTIRKESCWNERVSVEQSLEMDLGKWVLEIHMESKKNQALAGASLWNPLGKVPCGWGAVMAAMESKKTETMK